MSSGGNSTSSWTPTHRRHRVRRELGGGGAWRSVVREGEWRAAAGAGTSEVVCERTKRGVTAAVRAAPGAPWLLTASVAAVRACSCELKEKKVSAWPCPAVPHF